MRALGLSNVTVDQIFAARRTVSIATVQNAYNVTARQSEDVLQFCEAEGIGFTPYFSVGAGNLAQPGGPLDHAANTLGVSVSQLALAWLLRQSPAMLPIPGTSKVAYLEESCAAAKVELGDATFATLDAQRD